jgi:hypothetical protein
MQSDVCKVCGASGVRLWRLAHNFTGAAFCVVCMGISKAQRRRYAREMGRREARPLMQFGPWVPVVRRGAEFVGLFDMSAAERARFVRMPITKKEGARGQ